MPQSNKNTTTPDQQTNAMIILGWVKYDAFGRVVEAHYPQTAPLADWDKFLDSFVSS